MQKPRKCEAHSECNGLVTLGIQRHRIGKKWLYIL